MTPRDDESRQKLMAADQVHSEAVDRIIAAKKRLAAADRKYRAYTKRAGLA